jgi:hypothetical protein
MFKQCQRSFFYLLSVLFLVAAHAHGNMASPILEGSHTATVLSSKDIRILGEQVRISLDNDMHTAAYDIFYTIHSPGTGLQIPLLFYARDYKGAFTILLDGHQVRVLDMPKEHFAITNSPFAVFNAYLNHEDTARGAAIVAIKWEEYNSEKIPFKDLQYFEADLTEGRHEIRISYTAVAWTDLSQWVSTNSFRYALSPARYWKSFGGLDVEVHNAAGLTGLQTNLGQPLQGRLSTTAHWHFDSLPADYISIRYQPVLPRSAAFFISLSPQGMMLIFGGLMLFVHIPAIKVYRKKSRSRFSPVVILGSLLVPFCCCLMYIYSHDFIDFLIGPAASKRHGYTFLIFVFYPVVLPFYWVIMWLIDRRIKRNGISSLS